MQLILARDSFQPLVPLLDAARGVALNSPGAQLLAEYMLLLDRNIPDLNPQTATRLPNAVQAMFIACLAPKSKEAATAGEQVRFTLMERVRRVVSQNLRSPSLGVTQLCREAATSRSQLYRLLEGEGGVAKYIQRRRLEESFSMLCDASCNLAIAKLADLLCFCDSSTFSRAFRQEFGMTPGDVRRMALAGLPAAPEVKRAARPISRTFSDCLRGY
ncbi:MAG: helix-turn-helix domain-containing protein [Alphaproteobacteria bacterium]|nr:helix-turn-helix domain-containing protein [Alphaproteobacteria bacterium]